MGLMPTGEGRTMPQRRQLADRRRAVGLTQEELAELLRVDRTTVGRWESGATEPKPWSMPKLADVLNVTVEELLRLLERDDHSALPDSTAPNGDSPPIGVEVLRIAIAVVVKDDDVLLVHHRGEDGGGISWQFPSGMIKPGTSASATAVRETYDETGVRCAVRDELGSRLHPITNVYASYFFCDYLSGTAENRDVGENIDVAWVRRDDLTRYIPDDTIYPPVLTRLAVRSPSGTGQRDQEEPMNHNFEQQAIAAAVVLHERKVLLVRRRHKEGSLLWAFPSGHVEEGETAEEAAARETQEEVGLVVKPVKNLGERVHPVTKRRMVYVACSSEGDNARLVDVNELADLRWCRREELPAYVPNGFFPAVQEYLDAELNGATS